MATPEIGDRALYTLTDRDAELINSRRMAQPDAAKGNPASAGQTYPATVVAVHAPTGTDDDQAAPVYNAQLGQQRYAFEKYPTTDGNVNLQVYLDGYDIHWATDIPPRDDDGDDTQPGTYATT